MPWGRLEDSLHANGKVWSFSDKAFRVWMYSISFCNKKRKVDPKGFLSRSDAETLCRTADAPIKTIKEIVEKHGWDIEGDGYIVHDFPDYGPREDSTATERKRAERERRERERSPRDTDEPSPPSHADVTSNTHVNVTPESHGDVTALSRVTVTEGHGDVTRVSHAHANPVPVPVPHVSVEASTPEKAPEVNGASPHRNSARARGSPVAVDPEPGDGFERAPALELTAHEIRELLGAPDSLQPVYWADLTASWRASNLDQVEFIPIANKAAEATKRARPSNPRPYLMTTISRLCTRR